jgi:hypothetical protein
MYKTKRDGDFIVLALDPLSEAHSASQKKRVVSDEL